MDNENAPKLANKSVVEFYTEGQKQALKSGEDKRFPNLSLVRLVGRFFQSSEGKLLDYGCGGGANFCYLVDRGFDVYGVDTSPFSLEMVKNKIAKLNLNQERIHLNVLDTNAQSIPFADETFDFIVCASVLSLLSTKERILNVLNEFKRIIKPGGKLFLDINGPESEFAIYSEHVSDSTYIYKGRNKQSTALQVICPATKEEFSEMVAEVFQVEEVGFTAHHFFEYAEQEFIVCATKPKQQ